jgi:hypothetical protein
MEITARPGADADRRRAILERWYRAQLKHDLAPLLSKWETAIGVKAASWGVRKMRTRWGSCNPKAKRLWFNLELAKKSLDCLEYVVVHELIHLLERRHDARFKELMTKHLPEWRSIRESLNAAPLGQEPREL